MNWFRGFLGVLFFALSAAAQESTPPADEPHTPPKGPKISFDSVHVDGQYIALTFDDGPHATNTPRLLEMLAKRHIKATFFVIGECAREYPEILKRTAAEGHEIGNHSWSHPNLAKMSDEAVRSQLQKTADAIQAVGVKPTLMRPPYGNLTPRQRRWVNEEFGYKIILWDVDPLDWKYRNSARVKKELLAGARPGSILLAHDIHSTTIDAMPETLDELLARGFQFVTVSELLALEKSLPAPPKDAKARAPEQPSPPPAGEK
jgi:peptidoglycan/xylan/chitin deacetylase (PgdA/CDA1 family)